MTTDEKRQVIKDFCNQQYGCHKCPLFNGKFCDEHTEENAPEHIIDEWFKAIEDYEMDGHIPEAPTTMVDTDNVAVDNVNHPSHYETGKVECIDAMVETQGVDAVKNFCVCNAFKYLWRHRAKEGDTSIDKALWYLKKYVELRDGEVKE